MIEGADADRFAWERGLRDAPDVTGTRLLVLLALATFMDRDGSGARPSQATIATATGLGDRTVRRHLAEAVTDGYLRRESRGHRRGDGISTASSYRATLPTSTGHPVPVEADLNRSPEAGTDSLPASQPATGDRSTGHTWPPTTYDHVDQQQQGPTLVQVLDEIARREHDAALARGVPVHSPEGFRRKCHADAKAAHEHAIAAALADHSDWTLEQLVEAVVPSPLAPVTPLDPTQAAARQLAERNARRARREACPECQDSTKVLDDHGFAHDCPLCMAVPV